MKSPPPTQLSHPSAPAFLHFQYTGNYDQPSQIKVARISGYLCVAPVQCLGCEETIKQPTAGSLEMGKVGVPARGRHIWPQSQLAPLDRTFSVGWQHPSPPSPNPHRTIWKMKIIPSASYQAPGTLRGTGRDYRLSPHIPREACPGTGCCLTFFKQQKVLVGALSSCPGLRSPTASSPCD